eukprot:TRINITY_DN66355_c7_g3_i1.p1 TRINITY_DN66355_c7_g3~~TRINITY_DN66355_c7_g3_i1.p1  ORF type:complete len:487 (+),score=-2.02 TRINITY_DN66355_c7_g3_i1:218-1462(+)
MSTVRGFIPDLSPGTLKLPEPFTPWENAAQQLAKLIPEKTFVASGIIQGLPLLDAEALFSASPSTNWVTNEALIRRAHVLLTFLTQGYLFEQANDAPPTSVLPPQLAVPWEKISRKLGVPCAITHTSCDVWNWVVCADTHAANSGVDTAGADSTHQSSEPTDPNRIRVSFSMTGLRDEEWFFCSSTAIQTLAGSLMGSCWRLRVMSPNLPRHDVHDLLTRLFPVLVHITDILRNLRRHCHPDGFYNVLRPLLQGSATLPDGLQLQGVPDDENPQNWKVIRYQGASAAQSPVIQVLDSVLGILHSPKEQKVLESCRQYLPAGHRRFVDYLCSSWPLSVREFVNQQNDAGLTSIFDQCVQQLVTFRKTHMGIVKTHILAQKAKLKPENGATLGTGGSELEEFLQKIVNDTRCAASQ